MVVDDIRFIAEFTTNPMGNLNLLLRMVEKAAEAGCSLIKMQKKDVDTFYSAEKLALPYDSPYGKTYGDYRRMFEFSKEDFIRFDKACGEHNIAWFSTAQDIPSLNFVAEFDLPIYKVASANIRNIDLIKEVVALIPKDKEIVISTGGATQKEIDTAVGLLCDYRRLTILHCVAQYPCALEDCKMGNISALIERYKSESIDIGYSGHEEGYIPSLAAISLGAKMIERHFCISRKSFVHHIECSLEPEEYRELIDTAKRASCPADLKKYMSQLPTKALSTKFAMSDVEKEFLVEQKYGHKYLKNHSEII